MAADDLYGTLGVPTEATQAEITRAYRRLVRDLHPDLNPTRAPGETALAEVLAAYEVLGNAARRANYDRELAQLALREQALREDALREQAMRDQQRRRPGQADEWARRAKPPLRAGPIRVIRRPPGAR